MSRALQTAPAPVAARPSVPAALLVDVVVLSNDVALFEAAREAIGERNPVWRARSAEEAADLLLAARCGVLLIDMGAASTGAASLIVQISEQFPDLVVCVAGRRDHEPLLAPLISAGLVYRFMHKPVTARRAGMFLQAAIRHHVERRHALQARDPLAPIMRRLSRPTASLRWLQLAGVLAVLGIVTGSLFSGGNGNPAPAAAPSDLRQATPGAARANPVLSRARAALDAGRHEAPAGRNALDLFKAVLLEQPDHAEARAGLEETIGNVLEHVHTAMNRGNRVEAARLVKRILAVDPQRPEALALALELNQPETPSRQLVQEQVEEARRAAQARVHEAAVAATRAASAVANVPVPAAATQPTRPTAAAGQPLRATVDPLAPRYTNAAASPPAVTRRAAPASSAPLPLRHEIAGWAREPDVATPAVAAPLAEAAAAARDLQSVAADQLDRIEAREPVYPPQALRDRTHGFVELEFTISETGTVRDIDVVNAQPGGVFERAAMEALASWRFRPRYVNGQAVLQRSSITMRFDVDG